MAEKKTSTAKKEDQTTKQAVKSIKKALKKMNTGVLVIGAIFLVIGFIVGVAGAVVVTKQDCFVVNGEKSITLNINEPFTYSDEGAKVISLGRDLSSQVTVKTSLAQDEQGRYIVDTSVPGSYAIIYQINDIKYGNVQRIRTITVVGGDQ